MVYLLEGNNNRYISIKVIYLFLTLKVEKLRIKYLFFFCIKRYKPLTNGHKTRVKLYQASLEVQLHQFHLFDCPEFQ